MQTSLVHYLLLLDHNQDHRLPRKTNAGSVIVNSPLEPSRISKLYARNMSNPVSGPRCKARVRVLHHLLSKTPPLDLRPLRTPLLLHQLRTQQSVHPRQHKHGEQAFSLISPPRRIAWMMRNAPSASRSSRLGLRWGGWSVFVAFT